MEFLGLKLGHSNFVLQIYAPKFSVQNPKNHRVPPMVFTQYTVHSTQYTVHSTQYTVHSTQYTVHSTQYTVHSTQYTVHSTQYTVHSTQYTVHSTQYTVHSTQYTVHSTQYTVHSTQYTVHSTVQYSKYCPLVLYFSSISLLQNINEKFKLPFFLPFFQSDPTTSRDWLGNAP